MLKRYLSLLFHITIILSSPFKAVESNHGSKIVFTQETFSIEKDGEYDRIKSSSSMFLLEPGFPEMPIYTFNYGISSGSSYDISFSVVSSEIYDNIVLFPYQSTHTSHDKSFQKDKDFYSSDQLYPASNLVSEVGNIRGNEFVSVQFTPYSYDPSTKQLVVYTQVEININEIKLDKSPSIDKKDSELFSSIYNNMIINSVDRSNEEYQRPSILYIHSSYNSAQLLNYLQPLIDWRHQQGYIVDVVSTSVAGTSTSSIKSYISNAYNNWDDPPEYVCFVGDADGTYAVPTFYVQEGNGWSGAAGEGDFPYSLIDGGVNDLYADVILGRISIRSLTEDLNTVVNKIIGYEKAYGGIDNWQERAALVGDPYESGISTVITNQYIEQLMYTYGVEDVRTKYSGNNFDDFMRDQFNDGIAFLNYRGIYGFSGFSSNDVNALSPTWKLPFVTTLTCDTGSFWADNECISEALFRAGSPAQPKGAVAAVGIAQSYTHTAFNNIVDMGMYEGMYIFDAWHAGEALEYGRIALTETYPDNPNNNVYLFSTWNNLMGDPLTHLWTLKPIEISVAHQQTINFGTDYFQVEVVDQSNSPVPDAIVTLLKSNQSQDEEDEIFLTKKTNSQGVAFFSLDYETEGEVLVTAIGRNMKPSETSFNIQSQEALVEIVQGTVQVDDSAGNMNGILNGGEAAALQMQIMNTGPGALSNIQVELLSSNDAITVESSSDSILSLNPGEISDMLNFDLTVSSDADSENFFNSSLYISVLGYQFAVPIEVSNADLTFSPIMQSDSNNNGVFDRGESASFSIVATNLGTHGLDNLTGEILYSGSQLEFENSTINWSSVGGGSFSSSETIDVVAESDIINGSVISVPIELSSNDGYSAIYNWQVSVGNASRYDPLGPDMHGYYIYDQSDEYELAPTYEWIEIDADLGGPGYQLDIDDDGDNGDDSKTIDLPFTFTFYGIDYDEITVCSNGWISFGQTDMTSFRNYNLPGPGGPSPMLAVFWDDLQMNSGGDIYAWHDTQSDAFVIEWSGMRTFQLNSLNTFQAILYNSDYQTPTGDDEIKLQYKVFNNTSYGEYPVGNNFGAVIHGVYTTIGIENYNGQVGLEYTHNNQYPLTSMALDDETSLFITTRLSGSVPISIMHQQFPFETPYSGSSISFDATVESSTGSMNSVVFNYNLGQGWQSSPMTNYSGNNYNFILNGIDTGTAISYYFQAENSDGEQLVYPQAGVEDPFFFIYGEMAEVYSSSFESSSEGWSVGDVDDDAETGIWIRAVPNGTTYDGDPVQTSSANSGQYCYVTGNYTSNNPSAGDDDVDGGKTTLFSPLYDLSSYSYGVVSYWRWYTNEYGAAPGDDYWQVYASSDAGSSWVEIEKTNQSNNSWTEKTLFISDYVELSDQMQFKFVASDEGEGSLIEAALDDFQIRGTLISFSYQNGDVNNDGVLNILDILSIINITLGDVTPNSLEADAADVNNDSIINILDIIVLVNLILEA